MHHQSYDVFNALDLASKDQLMTPIILFNFYPHGLEELLYFTTSNVLGYVFDPAKYEKEKNVSPTVETINKIGLNVGLVKEHLMKKY